MCLSSLLQNRAALEKLVLDRDFGFPEKTADIKATVLSDVFWGRVQSVREVSINICNRMILCMFMLFNNSGTLNRAYIL